MATEFTPLLSFSGGLLIGTAAVLAMLLLGRILGATGILAGIIWPENREDFMWRAAMICGKVTGPLLIMLVSGDAIELQVPVSLPMLVIGGFLVGIGVTFGSGCTSGHGVCGLARFSKRSLVATLTFMATAAITVFLIRHVVGA